MRAGRCMKDWQSAEGFCEETFCEVSYREKRLLVHFARVLQLVSGKHTSLLTSAPHWWCLFNFLHLPVLHLNSRRDYVPLVHWHHSCLELPWLCRPTLNVDPHLPLTFLCWCSWTVLQAQLGFSFGLSYFCSWQKHCWFLPFPSFFHRRETWSQKQQAARTWLAV